MIDISKNKRILWWSILIAGFILFTFAGKIVTLVTDFLWFKELHLTPIFLTTFYSKIGCGAVLGALAWVIIYANVFIAVRLASRSHRYSGFTNIQIIELLNKLPIMGALLLIASLAVAFFIGAWASGYWEIYLKYRNAVPFGANDPLFGKDIAFYVFQLPFYRFLYHGIVVTLFFSGLGSLLVYLLHQNCVYDGRRLLLTTAARSHLLILIGILALSLFFAFHFKLYQMVAAQGPLISGAGYSQIKAGIPILSVMRFVSIAVAIMAWLTIFRPNYKLLGGGALLLVIGMATSFLATQALQKFVVGPDELDKEAPYIGWSIAGTRAAYGLNKIDSRHFVPTGDLDETSLRNNTLTVDNIRLWDHGPLLTTYSQLQEIRTYYEFLDVDNDRYMINGQYRQVMLSPRELVPTSLPSRSWINEHLTYTHGYGLCLGPVNSVTSEGLPDFFIKDIPPASTIPLAVARPQIYFGEANTGYAIVKTGAKEFDFPSGSENVYTVYNGKGGVEIGGFFRKALFALRFRELKILLRSDIGPGSKILFDRRILDRIKKAAPFLRYDDDPYMIVADDGRLVWMIDGYTVTNAYPYSATAGSTGNYIRNSIKAVIDAYDGSLDLYIADTDDPIIATYAKVFPEVFKPLSAMPRDLLGHIRYPQTLFKIQAAVYSVYHMTDPQVFYNKEDLWRIPNYSKDQSGPMSPYYTIMKLAEVGEKEEFILMVPFSPANKENMIAWLAARCDEPDYGKLLVFDFPKQKLIYGPSQIDARINQDPEISKQLTLWNQGGSRVIRGSLLVIPIEQSLIFVQPLYLTSSETGPQGGGVPELKRVIVAYENSIAMESTLEKSLRLIFDRGTTAPPAETTPPMLASETSAPYPQGGIKALITETNRQFVLGQDKLKSGDWTGYGEAMRQVERLLSELGKTVK